MRFSDAERRHEPGDGSLPAHPPALRTERLVLLPLGPEHAASLFVALREPEIYRYVPGAAPFDESVLARRYEHTSAGPRDSGERWWNWAVATHERAASPFGTVEITLTDNGARAHLAYMFGCSAWGHGYAFEASNAALACVRTRARTEHVDAYVDTQNARSIRLAERLGMQRVETIVGADHFKGSMSDEYHYRASLTADRNER